MVLRYTETSASSEFKEPCHLRGELVSSQLQQFTLNSINNIVCSTTGEALVLVKFGRLVLPKQQLCFLHAVYLAVTDVRYCCRETAYSRQIESEDK